MQFSRVGDHTIKCIISEEEIEELGYTLEEIMSNGARTQEFMNQIFDLAEQEFETKFDFGIKTVRADFLPDHSLSLTFSEHPVAEGMMEHLKDIVNGLLESIPKEKLDFLQKLVFELDGIGPKERLPFLLALANRAKKENISFSPDEVSTIIAVLKENSSPEEVQKMDKIIKMFQKK